MEGVVSDAYTAAMAEDFVSYCLELLAPLGVPRARRMFGGHGFYVDDLFLALIVNERFYLKVDEQTRAVFEAAGCEPFTYPGRDGRVLVMSYWTAPDEALDGPEAMRPWARRALDAALRARAVTARKPPRKAARKRPTKARS